MNSGRARRICMLLQNAYDTDIRVRRKAEALLAAGYAVDVLALRTSAPAGRYTLNGVQVFTVALAKRRGSIVRYAFEYAAFLGWASLKLLVRMWRRRYAVVEVNTLPDFLVFAAATARWMGARIVLDMHEITPEFYMSKYGIRRDARLVRLLAAVERRSFEFADHVITVNDPIRELLGGRGLLHSKSSVVMNAVDESLFRPEPVVTASDASPGRFVMMYHGTLTSVYGLPLAIEALALARRELPGAELWILGGGPERQDLERLAEARGVDSAVRFLAPVPPSEVAAWVRRCDAGVLPMRRDVFLDYAFPNKLSEYIVLDKPVIIARLRAIQHYFSGEALTYFEPGDVADLARRMIELASDPELRARRAARARAEYAPISWPVMKTRYLQTIDAVVSNGSRLRSQASGGAAVDMAAIRQQARATAVRLLEYCRANDWAGHDPYDALNSRLLTAAPILDTRPMRLLLTQALKRSPVDVRGLARVPRVQNAKALGLVLSALFKLSRAGVSSADDVIEPVIERLIALRSPGSPYWCWGYSFPWQTRHMIVPRDTPNLVCTAFVGGALLDAAERGDARCLAMATSAAAWIVNELYWRDVDAVGFAYPLPTARGSIHNANLLAAAFLARVARLAGQSGLLDPALRVARWSVARQRADGSWPYGEEPRQRWIDNFHTGYNLCALGSLGRDADTTEFADPLQRGLAFYRTHFFRPDGAARYFHDRTYPIDTHCVAQSLLTLFDPALHDPDNIALGVSVFRWAMQNLWDARGFFYYRVLRVLTIRTSYMRWSQAWMLLALAALAQGPTPAIAESPGPAALALSP